MAEPFLICGLPRSRTAWMAAAAQNDQSVCWHEPSAWTGRWDCVFDLWRSNSHRYVGVSDSLLGFHLPEIIARAAPRILVIERDIGDVEASGAALGLHHPNYCTLLKTHLAYAHPSIERVPYASLSDDRAVAACLLHLMPEAVIHMDRIKALQSMNVQTDIGRVREEASKADLQALFGPKIAAQLRAA